METFINVMKIITLALIALVTVSVFLETWHSCEAKDEERTKPKKKLLTLEETRESLWTTYIFNFH